MVAHQGGWDEALILLTPLALFVVLVRTAVVRARAVEGEPDEHHRPPAR